MQEEQQTNHLFQDSSLITFDQDHSNIESDPFLLERPKSSPKISKFRKLKYFLEKKFGIELNLCFIQKFFLAIALFVIICLTIILAIIM